MPLKDEWPVLCGGHGAEGVGRGHGAEGMGRGMGRGIGQDHWVLPMRFGHVE